MTNHNYERSVPWRRGLSSLLASADSALLALPAIRNMCGTAVFYTEP